MNTYQTLLTLIGLHLHPIPLQRVLKSLGNAVHECGLAIDQTDKEQDTDYCDAVVDNECAVIESLLGAAFVSCQAEITAVVSHVMQIHKNADGKGVIWTASAGKKPDILKLGQLIPGHNYTHVQAINAFANYFKHCDEWGQSWVNLTGKSKHTVDVIMDLGTKENGTGNFRAGVESLGITDYKQLQILSYHVVQWVEVVKNAYETDLKLHKLL